MFKLQRKKGSCIADYKDSTQHQHWTRVQLRGLCHLVLQAG